MSRVYSYSGYYIWNSVDDGYVWRIQREKNTTYVDAGSSNARLSTNAVIGFYYGNGATAYRRTMTETFYHMNSSGSWVKDWSGTVFSSIGKSDGSYYTLTLSGTWPIVAYSASDHGYADGHAIRVKIHHKCVTSLVVSSTYECDKYTYLPCYGPYNHPGGFAGSIGGPSSGYTYNYYTFSASGSCSVNGGSVSWRLLIDGSVAYTGSGASFSTGNFTRRFTSTGNHSFDLQYSWTSVDGSTSGWISKASKTINITLPPPSKPTMGNVYNNTAENVSTSINKSISASWTLDYDGRLSTSFIAKAYKRNRDSGAVSEVYSYSGSGTSVSATIALALNENVDVYWTISAINSLGSDSRTTGSVRLHRIYTEPSNITNVAVTPNRVMMLNGTTSTLYNVTLNINSWGDRPGTHQIVVFQMKDGDTLNQVYGKTENSVGSMTCQFTASVDESYQGQHLRFYVQKKIGGVIYNNTYGYTGFVEFYEKPAVCYGEASMSRSYITKNKPLTVYYNYDYIKNSSEKVQFILEVYDYTSDTIVNTFTLQTRDRDFSYSGNQSVIPFTSDGEQEHQYFVRLKSIVTELNGNQTVSVLGQSELHYNYEPIVQLDSTAEIPVSEDGLVIRFDSGVNYFQETTYNGTVNKCELIVTSSNGTEVLDITNGECRYDPPAEFNLNSSVSSFVRVYYDLGGQEETYESPSISLRVTPTRYVVWHTDNLIPERKNPKLHYKTTNMTEGYTTKIEVQEFPES